MSCDGDTITFEALEVRRWKLCSLAKVLACADVSQVANIIYFGATEVEFRAKP